MLEMFYGTMLLFTVVLIYNFSFKIPSFSTAVSLSLQEGNNAYFSRVAVRVTIMNVKQSTRATVVLCFKGTSYPRFLHWLGH